MSRNLEANEVPVFLETYGIDAACAKCGSGNLTVRIYEGYGSPAKAPGGDIGPGTIIGAFVICADCDHGITIARPQLSEKAA